MWERLKKLLGMAAFYFYIAAIGVGFIKGLGFEALILILAGWLGHHFGYSTGYDAGRRDLLEEEEEKKKYISWSMKEEG